MNLQRCRGKCQNQCIIICKSSREQRWRCQCCRDVKTRRAASSSMKVTDRNLQDRMWVSSEETGRGPWTSRETPEETHRYQWSHLRCWLGPDASWAPSFLWRFSEGLGADPEAAWGRTYPISPGNTSGSPEELQSVGGERELPAQPDSTKQLWASAHSVWHWIIDAVFSQSSYWYSPPPQYMISSWLSTSQLHFTSGVERTVWDPGFKYKI